MHSQIKLFQIMASVLMFTTIPLLGSSILIFPIVAQSQIPSIESSKDKATQLWREGMVFLLIRYQLSDALKKFHQAKNIFKQEGYKFEEATILTQIAQINYRLDNKQQAIVFYNEALTMSKKLKDKRLEVTVLNGMGWVYESLGKQQQALSLYMQVLPLLKDLNDLPGEATTLTVIGRVYEALGDKHQALAYYTQSLALTTKLKNRNWEATNLNDIGRIHSALGKQKLALEYFNQALPLWKGVFKSTSKAQNIRNIAFTLSQFNQPTLAITFYKQSINILEYRPRYDVGLPSGHDQIYLQAVHQKHIDFYRELVKLLLQQGRIMEALQVLDLLKVQELQDFFKDIKGNERTNQGIELLPQEQQILSTLNTSTIPDLNAYLNSPTVKTLAQQLQTTAAAQNLKLNAYQDLQTRLKTLSPGSALLYPLILDNSIELVLFTPNAPPIHKTVKVSKNQLEQAVKDFRDTIQRPDLNLKPEAQKLYTWLLKPLKAELAQAKIQTIVYAPDSILRYVPLAALHDGQQWAIEKYQINYVTAFALTSLTPKSTQPPRVLAAAYTELQRSTVTVNQKQFQFDPIPGAVIGVKRLAEQYPQTTLLLDKAFNAEAMASNRINGYSIVHLATHGKLVSGSPEDSFIVLNNGESITLRDLKNWRLPNVDLVVLSACETTLGGETLGSGIEILGFGYQLQLAQARAAIASLWKVSDDKTNRLMDLFYEQLKTGKHPPAESLALAQRAMIQEGKSNDNPFYWAPFILIGNGL